MSRNTVARLLELREPPRYGSQPVGSKLDPFSGSIVKMLDVDDRVPATVILEHLRRAGYEGGITILRDYLAEIRPLFRQAKSAWSWHDPILSGKWSLRETRTGSDLHIIRCISIRYRLLSSPAVSC